MGLYRVFKQSVRFTFRSKKRFLVFLLIFAIVSAFIAFYIDSLDDLRTDRLLEQKGVIMVENAPGSVSYAQARTIQAEIQNLPQSNPQIKIQDSQIYDYVELDSFIRLYSINIHKPWMSNYVKPSLIWDGHYPTNANEILVPKGAKQIHNSTVNGVLVESEIAVGQKFSFTGLNGNQIVLTVSGTVDVSKFADQQQGRLWIFADQSKFVPIMSLFGLTTANAFTHNISWLVPGTILSKNTINLVRDLNDAIKPLIADANNVQNGDWVDQPGRLPTPQAQNDANTNIVNLIFVVIGGVILATMFAYIISRFRRREIAILKAMGYSNGSVRMALIAEILTLSFLGFFVGLSMAQGLLYYIADFRPTSLLTWAAVGVSFAINVIISLPGMILASRRVLGVSPSEAFRDR